MSTRAMIGYVQPGGTIKGVYHHNDGYPSALGETLKFVYARIFDYNLKKMMTFLVDKHQAGWSSINTDWSKPPKANNFRTHMDDHSKPLAYPPKEAKRWFTGDDVYDFDYSYIFDPTHGTVTTLKYGKLQNSENLGAWAVSAKQHAS